MIGKRLHRARLSSKLSLRALAERMNGQVSAQAIGRYENDVMMPSSTVLLSLAEALGVTPEYLLSDDAVTLDGVDFRHGGEHGAKLDRSIEAKILDQVQRHVDIETLLSIERMHWRAPQGREFTIRSIEQAEDAANRLRVLWAVGDGPVASMANTLEGRAVKLLPLDLPAAFSGTKAMVRGPKRLIVPVIVVNKNQNAERQRFTYAHELAHLVLRLPAETKSAFKEKASDRFAGAFLVNATYLSFRVGGRRSALSLGELFELKREFRVSLAAMVVRCRQVDLISQALYESLWAELKAEGLNDANTAEPFATFMDSPQQLERMCYFAVSEQLISEAKAAEALQISARELNRRMSGHSALKGRAQRAPVAA